MVDSSETYGSKEGLNICIVDKLPIKEPSMVREQRALYNMGEKKETDIAFADIESCKLDKLFGENVPSEHCPKTKVNIAPTVHTGLKI
jgi:hypothetical protein